MREARLAVRLAPLLAVGALVLHKLNGLAGADTFAGHGHSYMPLAAALVTVLLVLACTQFARELWHASCGRLRETAHPSFALLWLIASGALIATFGLQEWIEGWITPGHPATVSHAVAHVGWTAPALAVAVGGLIALLMRGSRGAVEFLARRHRELRSAQRAARGRWIHLPSIELPRLPVLAANRGGRAPPIASFA